jgi:hypothetical protein
VPFCLSGYKKHGSCESFCGSNQSVVRITVAGRGSRGCVFAVLEDCIGETVFIAESLRGIL